MGKLRGVLDLDCSESGTSPFVLAPRDYSLGKILLDKKASAVEVARAVIEDCRSGLFDSWDSPMLNLTYTGFDRKNLEVSLFSEKSNGEAINEAESSLDSGELVRARVGDNWEGRGGPGFMFFYEDSKNGRRDHGCYLGMHFGVELGHLTPFVDASAKDGFLTLKDRAGKEKFNEMIYFEGKSGQAA